MIDGDLMRSLEAVRDGEIVETHLVRPILMAAHRAIDGMFEELLADSELLQEAKDAFTWGWEPEFLKTRDD